MSNQIDRVTSRGQLVKFQFMQDDVAASQTDAQLTIVQEDDAAANMSIAGVIVPFGGELIGITWKLSAAGTAGAFTVGPTIGGTEKTALTQTIGTAASGRATVPRGSLPFVAGDEIGAEITTDGSWDGTTSDFAVWVWAILYMDLGRV
jgi:hypothetical protein